MDMVWSAGCPGKNCFVDGLSLTSNLSMQDGLLRKQAFQGDFAMDNFYEGYHERERRLLRRGGSVRGPRP
jgi:hypothetical protein